MVGENQSSITLPSGIVERLDEFLKTNLARQMGISSRPQAVIMLLREFLDLHAPIKNSKDSSEIELVGVIDDKIILKDSVDGAVIVEIDEDKKLMCYSCKDDPHDNKFVRFSLKNPDLWNFLKKNKVKLVKARTIDKDDY